GDDAITIIARDSSYDLAANGVQDFTVSVNGGPDLLFIDTPTLAVNALGGSDTIALRTPAPNGAVWDVDVTIDGGEPTPAGDSVLVTTPPNAPAGTPDVVVYTPSSINSATLNLVTN